MELGPGPPTPLPLVKGGDIGRAVEPTRMEFREASTPASSPTARLAAARPTLSWGPEPGRSQQASSIRGFRVSFRPAKLTSTQEIRRKGIPQKVEICRNGFLEQVMSLNR